MDLRLRDDMDSEDESSVREQLANVRLPMIKGSGVPELTTCGGW